MCINIALPAEVRVNNKGQRLAGTGIFISKPGGGAYYDDPVALNICRLHFEERHNGDWGEIPRSFFIARPEGRNPFLQPEDEEDVAAFRAAIMEDSPLGRGYWKACPWEFYQLPHDNWEGGAIMQYCIRGRWAYVVRPPLHDEDAVFVEKGKPASLGGWYRDGYGCYLSYAIPVGSPIKLLKEEKEGNPYPALKIEIPRGTKYALWVRCSDSELHSGFVIVRLEWWDLKDGRGTNLYWKPLLASLFRAPHAFPAKKFCDLYEAREVPIFGEDIHAAVKLAEHISEHGFKPKR